MNIQAEAQKKKDEAEVQGNLYSHGNHRNIYSLMNERKVKDMQRLCFIIGQVLIWYRHSQLEHPELEFNTFLKRRNEKILSPPLCLPK